MVKKEMKEHPIFKKGETEAHIEDDGRLYGVIGVDLYDLLALNPESFLDMVSNRLTGGDNLSDVTYSVVGFESPETVFIEIGGDPALVLERHPAIKKMWDEMEQRLADKEKSKDRHQRKRKKS